MFLFKIKNIKLEMSKNILITGGGGFIGCNMIKHLLNDTSVGKITVFDNFISSNKNDFETFKNTYDILLYKIEFFEYDITNLEQMTFVKFNFHFDEIYHLASLASPLFYKKFPLETLDVGYHGTKHILEIAKEHKAKVLFSSTSEVYGDPILSPQNENYFGNVNSFGARSAYDESKRVAESLCYTYINSFGLDIKIARIFNTFGPNMLLNDGRIITECIKHLMYNTTLKIYGDGNQTRSICYVSNTVNMLVKLMNTNGVNIPVNIGNNEELTINKIVEIIEKVYQEITPDTQTILKKEYVKLTENDPLKRQPCLKRNKEILGEEKYISIQQGIKKTIEYYKKK